MRFNSDEGTDTKAVLLFLSWLGFPGGVVLQVGCASTSIVSSADSGPGVGMDGFSTGSVGVTGSFVV